MRAIWLLPLLGLLLTACAGEPDDPEARLRATIAQAEQAIEARELKNAAGFVASGYRDEQGRDARAVRQLLLGYLYRHRHIHLLVRIADLQLAEGGKAADARLYVAMTGVPLQSFEALVSVRADLHRFDLQFADGEAGWQVTAASWQRAGLDDMLE